MERLTQILFVLSRAPGRTAGTEQLLQHVGYGADKPEDRRRQLTRDIRHLTDLGWEITTVGSDGEAGRYRLVAGDLRLRVEFSAQEQAELQRAARAAELSLGDASSGDDRFVVRTPHADGLDLVQRAASAHCRLGFDYRGVRRQVHPVGVHLRPGGWYLRARQDDESEVRTFRVDRMTALELARPGTAEVAPVASHLSIDPITWRVDPPVVARLSTTAEHVPQVGALLGPVRETPGGGPDGSVQVEVDVTNRVTFRGRLFELGSRVRLLGPQELRDEIRDHLQAVVAGTA